MSNRVLCWLVGFCCVRQSLFFFLLIFFVSLEGSILIIFKHQYGFQFFFRAQIEHRYSKLDQANLQAMIIKWQSQDAGNNFLFRPYKVETSKKSMPESLPVCHGSEEEDNVEALWREQPLPDSLLFCHQTKWQQRLLDRYGGEICFLDATYKTTRYALPLFFIAVKTNVNYIVVGSFVIQQETTAAIQEALEVFRDWNSHWQPEYFMTDFSEGEISAIENVFPGKKIILRFFFFFFFFLIWHVLCRRNFNCNS